jgi:membrane dipeptidase
MKVRLLACFIAAALSASVTAKPVFNASEQAQSIAKKYIMVDGHIDVPYRLEEQWVDVTQATQGGDFDYPRAIAGGLNAPFMSIYIPASLDNSAKSTDLANKLIDYVEAIVGRAPDKFAIAKSVADVEQHFKQGLISLPMGMENGSPIQGSLDNLRHFYQRGIRYITLAHSMSNHISDSSYDLRRKWKGLSPFGKELVAEMNNLGIMIDISHVSDDAFYQVIELTRAPVIASHSSLRKFTPGFERNMDDDMIKALAKNGGVVMINFGSTFVDQTSRAWRTKMGEKRKVVEEKFGKDSEQAEQFESQYRKQDPFPYADVNTVVEHIDHVVKLVGIEHVGLGSDFDGVGDSLPEGLKDVSMFPNLIQALLDKGYSESDIAKIMGINLLRVWRQVEKTAAATQTKA